VRSSKRTIQRLTFKLRSFLLIKKSMPVTLLPVTIKTANLVIKIEGPADNSFAQEVTESSTKL